MNSVLGVVDIPILRLGHTFIPSILVSSTLKKREIKQIISILNTTCTISGRYSQLFILCLFLYSCRPYSTLRVSCGRGINVRETGGDIKNGKSRETDNIVHTRRRPTKLKNKNKNNMCWTSLYTKKHKYYLVFLQQLPVL